jgi:hypothetical protein
MGLVAHMGKMINLYKILVEKPDHSVFEEFGACELIPAAYIRPLSF